MEDGILIRRLREDSEGSLKIMVTAYAKEHGLKAGDTVVVSIKAVDPEEYPELVRIGWD